MGFRASREVKGCFRASVRTSRIVTILRGCCRTGVMPRGALVVFSRVRVYRETLASLGCFSRRTPRCRMVTTKDLLNITIGQRGCSFPIKGIRVLAVCPVSLRRIL